MNHLMRDLAPISAAGWLEIEKEAKRTLKATLAARRIVDFKGPQGWEASAVAVGRSQAIDLPAKSGVTARLRQVLPLVELRVPFLMRRDELDDIERGARDPDLATVIAAARAIAMAEDHAVFHGLPSAGIRGICETQAKVALSIGDDYEAFPEIVTTALNRLRDEGVDGPYAIALGEQCYAGVTDTTSGGYPVLDHVRHLVDGPLVWAPDLDGAVVLSMRGEDFELTVGEDFSIGYLAHDAETVRLYLEESFTFWLLSPQAAIPLVHRAAAAAAPRPTPRARAA
ncbi:MAG TPA: family 1 encapsulin nanocompartment shell protein [Stellaceae bacterium]|nr:family 1 encapsulin nanocompartment shell protein [Stellaceae bacterium]